MRAENVLDCSFDLAMPSITVGMHYIGGDLSVNRYKWGRFTKPVVKEWMRDLALVIRVVVSAQGSVFTPPITVTVGGCFRDKRSSPDLHNLHKVIGDALEDGLGINDKEFRFVDGESSYGCKEPYIIIETKSRSKE